VSQQVNLTIYNAVGVPVLSVRKNMQPGINNVDLNPRASLPGGTYFFVVRDEKGNIIFKTSLVRSGN
jgi:hypothetical protein